MPPGLLGEIPIPWITRTQNLGANPELSYFSALKNIFTSLLPPFVS